MKKTLSVLIFTIITTLWAGSIVLFTALGFKLLSDEAANEFNWYRLEGNISSFSVILFIYPLLFLLFSSKYRKKRDKTPQTR